MPTPESSSCWPEPSSSPRHWRKMPWWPWGLALHLELAHHPVVAHHPEVAHDPVVANQPGLSTGPGYGQLPPSSCSWLRRLWVGSSSMRWGRPILSDGAWSHFSCAQSAEYRDATLVSLVPDWRQLPKARPHERLRQPDQGRMRLHHDLPPGQADHLDAQGCQPCIPPPVPLEPPL